MADRNPTVPVSLAKTAAALPDLWSPRILGRVNDQFLKVVRVQGDFPWHTHADEDELFLVLSGALTIGRLPVDGGPVTLLPGEAFIVPRGMRHNTSAATETLLALVEPVSTQHTGEEITPLTRSLAEQMGDAVLSSAAVRKSSLAGQQSSTDDQDRLGP